MEEGHRKTKKEDRVEETQLPGKLDPKNEEIRIRRDPG